MLAVTHQLTLLCSYFSDSENAKAMMPDYHIGHLDPKSLATLLSPEPQDESSAPAPPRAVFLQPKFWNKATLSSKQKVSSDTKVFIFTLDHSDQTIGLPVGQHLLMRLRDPSTQEAVIRAYTPISEGTTDRGELRVLVKIYYEVPGLKGGKMTQALDSLALGSAVEFKGPIGKFEYKGKGVCLINGRERSKKVRKFVMVCAGSGITPIFQVLRAVVNWDTDHGDGPECLVLDGNRVQEDILCRKELDELVERSKGRCKVLYTLSRPEASWRGLKGRLGRALFEREVGGPPVEGDAMVLVCGPEPMEKATKAAFLGMGWKEEDLLFF